MRTLGLGWTQFAPGWGYEPAEKDATITKWRKLLIDDIFPHEIAMRRQKKLPKAAVPRMQRVPDW